MTMTNPAPARVLVLSFAFVFAAALGLGACGSSPSNPIGDDLGGGGNDVPTGNDRNGQDLAGTDRPSGFDQGGTDTQPTDRPVGGDAGADVAPSDVNGSDLAPTDVVGSDVPAGDVQGADVQIDHISPDIPPGSCDPVSQQPCSQSQACTVTAGVVSCVNAGSITVGMACGSGDNGGCARGLVCANAPGASSPTCLAICDAQAPNCQGMTECTGIINGFDSNHARLCVPFTTCDILDVNSCGTGQKCDLATAPRTECFQNGNIAAGSACGNGTGSCVAGTICTSFNGAAFACHNVCDSTGSRLACPQGTGTCRSLNDYPGVGFCAQ